MNPTMKREHLPEPVLDFIIRVNRSVKLSYPGSVRNLMNPEFEFAGRAEYDLQAEVEQWLHDDQKTSMISGNIIYDSLKKDNAIASCLNLQDGLAIQQKGIAVFRKLFADKVVLLWGSVFQDSEDKIFVPCFREQGNEIVARCRLLEEGFDYNDPALRFI